MTDDEMERERSDGDDAPPDDDEDLLAEQEGKGYGEDEGERGEALDDE